jgi:hypothetical protein
MTFELCSVAPRLARARDAFLAEQKALAEAAAAGRRLENRRDRLERLVAHRELQLLRAAVTGKPDYERARARKLAAARRELDRLTRETS